MDTAFHEAGHAVMAFELGIPIASADIVGDDDAAGRVLTNGSQRWMEDMDTSYEEMPAWVRRRLEGHIMMTWAGPLAGYMHRKLDSAAAPTDQECAEHGSFDFATIGQLLFRAVTDEQERVAYGEWLRIRAWNMLHVPLVWREVEAVAEALAHRRRLSGRAVRTVCKTTRDQLLRDPSALSGFAKD